MSQKLPLISNPKALLVPQWDTELKIQHIFLTIFWDSSHSETEGTESAKGQSSKTAARCHFCRTATMHCCAFTILALLCWRDLRTSGYLWTMYRGSLSNIRQGYNTTFGSGKKSHLPNFAFVKYLANGFFGQNFSLVRFFLYLAYPFFSLLQFLGQKSPENYNNEMFWPKKRIREFFLEIFENPSNENRHAVMKFA